jgi:hypothetical protein
MKNPEGRPAAAPSSESISREGRLKKGVPDGYVRKCC